MDGAERVHLRLSSAYLTLDERFRKSIYLQKSRVKSEDSVRNKIIERRRRKPQYQVSDVKDVVGFRLVTLYEDHLLSAFHSVLELLNLCASEHVRLFASEGLNSCIDEIKVFHRNHSKDDPYVKLYKIIHSKFSYLKVPEIEHRETGYSSVHILVTSNLEVGGKSYRTPIEFQIRTALEDVWAEISHKLAYKEDYSLVDRKSPIGRIFQNAKENLSELKRSIDVASRAADKIKSDFDFIDIHISEPNLDLGTIVFRDEKEPIPCSIMKKLPGFIGVYLDDYMRTLFDIHASSVSRNRGVDSRSFSVDFEALQEVSRQIVVNMQNQHQLNENSVKIFIESIKLYQVHYQLADAYEQYRSKPSSDQNVQRVKSALDDIDKLSLDFKNNDPYLFWLNTLAAGMVGKVDDQLRFAETAFNGLQDHEFYRGTELGFLIPSHLAYLVFLNQVWSKISIKKMPYTFNLSRSEVRNLKKCVELAKYALKALDEYEPEAGFLDFRKERNHIDCNIVSFYAFLVKSDKKYLDRERGFIVERCKNLLDTISVDSKVIERMTISKAHTYYWAAKFVSDDSSHFKSRVIGLLKGRGGVYTPVEQYIALDIDYNDEEV